MADAATDTHTEMAMLWCTTFTEADYPRCRQIAFDMVEQARREGLDEPMFAYKSIAQSLHFMGEHSEAKRVAEWVLREAKQHIACTTIHPAVSMGIVLARIACLENETSESTQIALDVFARSRRENPIAVAQTLALACLPIAIWNEDERAAIAFTRELIEEAEVGQLNYWRHWGRHMLRAIDLHFNPRSTAEGILEIDGLDPMLADHLATIDARALSQLAVRRMVSRVAGWSAPEVLRIQASTAMWYDPTEARRLLTEARDLGVRQQARAWLARIEKTEILFGGGRRPGSGAQDVRL